jgi:hypothetical protein
MTDTYGDLVSISRDRAAEARRDIDGVGADT